MIERPSRVIYNGVHLGEFSPHGERYVSESDICIMSVEGAHGDTLRQVALPLCESLGRQGARVELLVFGRLSRGVQNEVQTLPYVKYQGVVANSLLPYYYRGASFYLSLDVIAACPNSVVEALACGTPVVGFHAGVLPELLSPGGGICVGCEGDPWRGEAPGNLGDLHRAALDIVDQQGRFRSAARALAEKRYDVETMLDQYIDVLFPMACGR